MPANETSPLLGRSQSDGGLDHPAKTFRPLKSSWFLLTNGWLNVLLVTVPVTIAAKFVNWPATVKFVISFLSIIPLAALLGDATEQLSMSLSQSVSALLNATFGNAVELLVGIVALQQDQLRLVQTSMLGSILSNILLVLGCSFAAAGTVYKESTFRMTAAQTSSGIMTLACVGLVIPAAYHSTYARSPRDGGAHPSPKDLLLGSSPDNGNAPAPHDGTLKGLLVLSRGTAIILLGVYMFYLYFQLKSHASLFEADAQAARTNENGEVEEEEKPEMDAYSAFGWLAIVTVATAVCADVLVASIDETAAQWNLPKAFIGLILLPIVGNAAEHVTSVWMAMKGKMEITIGVSVGSSIQIAAGMIPILVLAAWPLGKNLTLYFADFETIMLFVSVMLVNILLQDGRTNYIEGVLLIALYLIIALAYFVSE